MKKVIVSMLIMGLISLAGCSNAGDQSKVNPKIKYGKVVDYGVVDYGNGVYYFESKDVFFANALSAFLTSHPELEVSSSAGNGTCGYGSDCGYFVTFRKKK